MTIDAGRILAALRRHIGVHDRAFDGLYPDSVRRASSTHWTPVSVALDAAAWLAPEPGVRVLDIGCGPGKLCCIGAAARGGTWHGVERDPGLVDAANTLARMLDLDGATSFTAGEMESVDWRTFDSLYFYNPFAASLFGPAPFAKRIGWTMLTEQIERTEALLAELPTGTRVVTYEGFGGDMPDGYVLTHAEMVRDGQLALWIKRRTTRRARVLSHD